jgi:hypothetical protein
MIISVTLATKIYNSVENLDIDNVIKEIAFTLLPLQGYEHNLQHQPQHFQATYS